MLNCCGLTLANPTKVFAKGSGPSLQPVVSTIHLTSTVGLGFGLSNPIISPKHLIPPLLSPQEPLKPPSKTCTSFLSMFVGMNGFNHSTPFSFNPLSTPPSTPNIKVVSPKKFTHLAKDEEVCYLHFHNPSSPTPPPPEPDGLHKTNPLMVSQTDPEEDFHKFVPGKYWPWAESVFNPSEFDKLPEHRPFDINIELKEGKSPPFSPIYHLTPDECKAVAEYVN